MYEFKILHPHLAPRLLLNDHLLGQDETQSSFAKNYPRVDSLSATKCWKEGDDFQRALSAKSFTHQDLRVLLIEKLFYCDLSHLHQFYKDIQGIM